jgi:hypothetical protein
MARLSKEERLQRLVDDCREKVGPRDAAAPISLSQTPKRHLKVLVKAAGYQRKSTSFLELLDSGLKAAGIGTFPDLLDPTITRDTRIYLFDLDHPIPGLQSRRVLFSEEKQLSDLLVKNFKALTYIKKAGLHLLGREVHLADGCIIDLLAEDKKSRELVGFELKGEEGDDRLAGQALRYMRALARRAKKEGRAGARLLIVTGQPDQNLHKDVQLFAEKEGVKTQWLLYRVTIDLTEAP